ncbi:MAG: molybdopterin-dependent oxidoreductase [Puniceicoccales bacterium]|jgi:NADH-quinone oxidoreductase subunit G|nr:molybdopterin-dependent oxidoreductase [Puniceicoccales bacterium]
MDDSKIKITLNGEVFEFDEKILLLDALAQAKIELPSPCHHDHLSQVCSCGLCLVGLRTSATVPWVIGLACMVTIKNGMEVDTECPQAAELRKSIINAYLLKHPMDCSLCDKVGNCFLHKFAAHTNFRGFTRLMGRHYWRRSLRKLGEKIAIDDEKCIFCGRCLRFCQDILGEEILGKIKNERNSEEINLYPGKDCDSNYSLNLVELCPAGALVDQVSDYDQLAWDLHHTPSISPESSTGINIYILHSKKYVHRIVARRNDSVNETWITDSARNLVNILKPSQRTAKVMCNGGRADIRVTIALAVDKILRSGSNTYILCSGATSLEDQFVLKQLLDALSANMSLANVYFLRRKGKGDDFLISDDPYPNCAGAEIMKLSLEFNTHENLGALYDLVQSGTCKNIICVYEDLFAERVNGEIFNGIPITYIGHQNNKTARTADFVFPVKTIFERTGTFVNKDYILQKFFQAVPAPSKSILECWEILSLIMNTHNREKTADYLTREEIWKDLSNFIEVFRDINFSEVPLNGLLLKKD